MNRWTTQTLESVAKFIDYRGKTPKKVDKGLRLITAKNVKKGYLQKEPEEFVEPEIYESWMTRGIPIKGDVLFTTEAPLGNVTQLDTDEKVVFAQRIIILQPNKKLIDPVFLKYLLLSKSMQKVIQDKGTGATAKGIKSKLLKKIEISFPPLEEQKRIVEILDKAFEGIAIAEANTKKNLANAIELFDSYLNKVFMEQRNLYPTNTLGDFLETLTDYHANGSYKILKENVHLLDDGYAHMVRSTDFENDFKNSLKYIDEHAYHFLSKSKIFGNEIIISKIGNAGKVYLMPEIEQPSSLAMNLFLLRVDQVTVKSEYLYFFLESNFGKRQIAERLNGTTTKTIRKDGVRSIKVFVPPINEQEKIIENLKKIKIKVSDLEIVYQRKLVALAELKQSILQKAFTGQLTT